ncbi:MAG: sulfur carrier protein ThiS [Planctomycetes bacterium]|nr:sulfur carrier protein ThiS [Planctomycetota bacterium]NOG54222.1 sulfur carrier protein ThiS [Planctomycetota bacterium]
MKITVNNTEHDVPETCTVAELVQRLGLAQKPVAVEVNRTLITRSKHTEHTLSDGDAVEVVTLVGGG